MKNGTFDCLFFLKLHSRDYQYVAFKFMIINRLTCIHILKAYEHWVFRFCVENLVVVF
jgi:hypothetical protein